LGIVLCVSVLLLLAGAVRVSAAPLLLTEWGSQGSGNGQFFYPLDVATDSIGNVYVADSNNHRIQKFTSSGEFVAKWGKQGSADGDFAGPGGVATDSAGNVYVADTGNHRIEKFSSSGEFIAKWGKQGSADGDFNNPWDVATDSAGNTSEIGSDTSRIQKFSSSGAFITQWGSLGSADGQFNRPRRVATDSTGNVYVADEYNGRVQAFSSSGAFITKWARYGLRSDGTGAGTQPTGLATDPAGNVYVADKANNHIEKFSPAVGSELLRRYVPGLLYEQQERYRADSAAEITGSYVSDGSQRACGADTSTAYSNYLKRINVFRETFEIFAASDPDRDCADLSLDSLRPTYSDGVPATSFDVLDEHNGTEQVDAERLHLNPAYANRVYGRAVVSGGITWLQYWFFYYYNPYNALGQGVHEGDWEMIQLGLRSDGTPLLATYAQHGKGESCSWDEVEKIAGTRPVVYVANGSHASYLSSGFQPRVEKGVILLPTDYHSGDGDYVDPMLEEIANSSPRWVSWPGKWGASDSSPRGPRHQHPWNHPLDFALNPTSSSSSCGGSPPITAAEAPSAPQLTAARRGDKIAVSYRFEGPPKDKQGAPTDILLTVRSADKRHLPNGKSYPVRARSGRQLIRPFGHGPYTVAASAFAKTELRSRVVKVRVP
jgi:hypothetical protein